jgi:hypothetical protein
MTHGLAFRCVVAVFLAASLLGDSAARAGDEPTLLKFKRQRLTDVYFSEGANAGDLNRDGHADVVYGPYWFQGPDFKAKHELYPPKPQNREGYADNFFNWVYDFNGDGWNDVFVVGFPGKPGYVYENPKGDTGHWKKHQVFDSVGNESPHLVDLLGDKRPELICTFNGAFGFATIDWTDPFKKWAFHVISKRAAPKPFGHGLGVGDVDGDGRNDIIVVDGWFQQPKADAENAPWTFHAAPFSNAYGGAEMHAYDVDGDGHNDIITSLAAHDYGLAWYQQDRSGPVPVFRQHMIMGRDPKQSRYGKLFTELHSVALVDLDGDGLKDIVTGRTYYSHHKQSPLWDAGAVVYWFRLVRTPPQSPPSKGGASTTSPPLKEGANIVSPPLKGGAGGVDWVPHELDGVSGIGRQISIADVNGDKLPDIVVGGMVGSHVLLQSREKVSRAAWEAAQPKPLSELIRPVRRGPFPAFDKETKSVVGAIEAESMKVIVTEGKTLVQTMNGFPKDRWSGDKQLFWTDAKPGARLELTFEVGAKGNYAVSAAFTMARDFGIVRVLLDDATMGSPIDLYNFPDVLSTGALPLGSKTLDAGNHRLTLELTGVNPAAVGDRVGIDYVRLTPE